MDKVFLGQSVPDRGVPDLGPQKQAVDGIITKANSQKLRFPGCPDGHPWKLIFCSPDPTHGLNQVCLASGFHISRNQFTVLTHHFLQYLKTTWPAFPPPRISASCYWCKDTTCHNKDDLLQNFYSFLWANSQKLGFPGCPYGHPRKPIFGHLTRRIDCIKGIVSRDG